MIEELAQRIWARTQFQEEYRALLRTGLRRSLPPASAPHDLAAGADQLAVDEDALGRLLQSATHFAAVPESAASGVYHEAAYRIAVSAWALHRAGLTTLRDITNLREIVHLVLARLGHFPAVEFLFDGTPEAQRGATIPLPAWIEVVAHREHNTVELPGGGALTFTDFQRTLWEALTSGASTAVTAPTSAGKSFALQRYLVSKLLRSPGEWALYLVPTRALINQVSAELLEAARQLAGSHSSASDAPDGQESALPLHVSGIPLGPEELGASGGVYVLTQERLQVLLENAPQLAFSLAIIDEAQMLGDDSRGVILQTVIESILARSPQTQLLFGSPHTRNPHVFADLFDLPDRRIIRATESPVAQNLVLLDRDPDHRRRLRLAVRLGGREEILGELVLDRTLPAGDRTLAYLSHLFGAGQKNLVYAGSRSRCEKIAAALARLGSENGTAPAVEDTRVALATFASFVREHVHPAYELANVLPAGVAFHYGNLPAAVRKTIEDYFNQGLLTHLVCTSTLLHGVNLPAKNLFLLNPTKGRPRGQKADTPISSTEFWNLAGRAGRLGRDFEGSVFLIDRRTWLLDPLEGEQTDEVMPAVETTVVARHERFLQFIQDQQHKSGADQGAENTFVKLVNEARAGTLERTLERLFKGQQSSVQDAVRIAIEKAVAAIDVPVEVTRRHANVSVYRQQEMLDYLVRRIGQSGPEELLPVHPLGPWDAAYESYIRLFKRIHTQFQGLAQQDRSHRYFGLMALRWMRGESLPQMIDSAFDYRRQARPGTKIGTVIRDVMDTIEQDLRFRYVKYTACYRDLLAAALRRSGRPDLIGSIPTVDLFLELGASTETLISLISLGLSRTAASLVGARAPRQNMNRLETEAWLRRAPIGVFSLSPIVLREVYRAIGQHVPNVPAD